MFTILGAGFGLYGYLPALFEAGETGVVLPERYRAAVDGRVELRRYAPRISWVADRAAALAAASGAILAIRPADQPAAVHACLARDNLRRIVLEKPIAPDPAAAAELLAALLASGRRFRVGYLFLLAPLHEVLRAATAGDRPVSVAWSFTAHHFAHGLDNWKRQQAPGGGVLRFYAIHLLAALADCGYRRVDASSLHGETAATPERWAARFSGPGRPECTVVVDSRADRRVFEIAAGEGRRREILADVGDLFDGAPPPRLADLDRRVGLLAALIRSFADPDAPLHDLYLEANRLWTEVETRSG